MICRTIDPGNIESGTCIFNSLTGEFYEAEILDNHILLEKLKKTDFYECEFLYIEDIISYGQPVGNEVFNTCVWIGRFIEAWHDPNQVTRISRVKIKKYLQAKNDAEVRKAVIAILGLKPVRGSNIYAVTSHMFSALAIAIYATRFKNKASIA